METHGWCRRRLLIREVAQAKAWTLNVAHRD